MPPLTPGRILLTLSQLSYSIGSFLADYNETHVLNPRWPPHARFHNGQTMSLAVLLAGLSIWFLYRPSYSGKIDDTLSSAIIGSLYSASGLSAIWYPGSDWLDPEFIKAEEPRRPQLFIFGGILVLVWAGWALEGRRLRSAQGKEQGKRS
jgi:hypothetical protein